MALGAIMASILPSLISTGGGLLSSVFGGIASQVQNKSQNQFNWNMYERQFQDSQSLMYQQYGYNRGLARDAMNFSEESQRAQNDWNYQMWQRENEYDSPDAQRKRLIEAGYNPLMLNSGSFQDASPIQGASAPSGQSASVSPQMPDAPNMVGESFQFDPNTLANLVRSFSQAANLDADTKSKNIENEFKPDLYVSEIEMKKKSLENLTLQIHDLSSLLPFNSKHRENQLIIEKYQMEAERLNNELIRDTLEARKEQLKWLPKISEKQWESFEYHKKLILKQVQKLDSDMVLQEAQEKKLIAETATLDTLRPSELQLLREQILRTRMQSAMSVLEIPTAFRGGFLKTLEGVGWDTSGFIKGAKGSSYWKDPNETIRALMLVIGLLRGDVDYDDILPSINQHKGIQDADANGNSVFDAITGQ